MLISSFWLFSVLGFHDDASPIDFFAGNSSGDGSAAPPLPYRTDKFPSSTFPMRETKEDRLTEEQYVEVIRDIIKMNKNVVLCRNMALLDKAKVSLSYLLAFLRTSFNSQLFYLTRSPERSTFS